jgi:hypothetical protein
MARQGGQVQLEPSDMHLTLYMENMDKGRFPCATIEETQYLVKIPQTYILAENKWGVEFHGCRIVKAALVTHLAMLQ